MRVTIDATSMPADRAGVAVYLLELIGALDAFAGTDNPGGGDALRLVVIAKPSDAAELSTIAPHCEIIEAGREGRAARLAWEQTALPRLLRKLSPDLVHCPHYTMPYLSGLPSVVVFHDATFFTNPEYHERSKVWFFGLAGRLSKRRARRLIAVSAASRTEICRILAVNPSMVDVVHHGVDHSRYEAEVSPGEIERVRSAYGIGDRPYLLFMGTLQPRKNVPRLIDAFAQARKSGLGHALVIAGGPGWKAGEIDAAEARAGLGEVLIRTGHVPEADKAPLLAGAAALAYPSYAEGFGLPILEAMAAGTPVITSAASAMAEVGADAACLVNPRDTAALMEAIESVLGDDVYAAELREAGQRRAAGFTWERCATETIASWERAVYPG